MNERIIELMEQATDEVGLDANMFAELIIRECAEVAGCNGHVSGFTLGDLIKEHFGVE